MTVTSFRPRLQFDRDNPDHRLALKFIDTYGHKIVSKALCNQLVALARKSQTEGLRMDEILTATNGPES